MERCSVIGHHGILLKSNPRSIRGNVHLPCAIHAIIHFFIEFDSPQNISTKCVD